MTLLLTDSESDASDDEADVAYQMHGLLIWLLKMKI